MIDTSVQRLVDSPRGVRVRGRAYGEKRPLRQAPRRRWVDPLWLGVVATVVVAIGSWIPSKWNDEAATQTAATRTLPQLWQLMQNVDAVHGTYYFLMHFWILAFGSSNFALRAPSMLAVGVACAGVVVLGKQLGDRRFAIFAGLAFVLLPRVTWMGMEARSTALTAVVAVWLTVLLLRAIERRTALWWIFYGALAAVGVLLNIYLALLVVAHGVSIVLARRRLPHARRVLVGWGAAAIGAGILSFPIDRLSVTQRDQLPFGPLTLTNSLNAIVFQQYFSGATPTVGRGIPVPPTSLWAVGVILAAAVGWMMIIAPIASRRFRPKPGHPTALGFLGLVVPWFVVPSAVVLLLSLLVQPMYTGRYFAFTTPAIALLIGASAAAFRLPRMRIASIGLLALLVLPVYVAQRVPTAKNGTDWQQAAAILQAHARPGEDIYYGPARRGDDLSDQKISEAYPAVLSSLHDITRKSSPIQTATLWGSSWPLARATAELDTAPLLWVVISHPGLPSPLRNSQERYIEQQGLHLAHAWRGSETDVLEYTR